jgi:hypothetical protein
MATLYRAMRTKRGLRRELLGGALNSEHQEQEQEGAQSRHGVRAESDRNRYKLLGNRGRA